MSLSNITLWLLGIRPPGGRHINADEIAAIGLGAAAFVGAIGYLIIRWRNAKHQ
jgi:hypothetical protein